MSLKGNRAAVDLLEKGRSRFVMACWGMEQNAGVPACAGWNPGASGQDAKVWALVKRSATSSQLTTFHQALT